MGAFAYNKQLQCLEGSNPARHVRLWSNERAQSYYDRFRLRDVLL